MVKFSDIQVYKTSEKNTHMSLFKCKRAVQCFVVIESIVFEEIKKDHEKSPTSDHFQAVYGYVSGLTGILVLKKHTQGPLQIPCTAEFHLKRL